MGQGRGDPERIVALSVLEDAVKLLRDSDRVRDGTGYKAKYTYMKSRETAAWLRDSGSTMAGWCDLAGVDVSVYRSRLLDIMEEHSPRLLRDTYAS